MAFINLKCGKLKSNKIKLALIDYFQNYFVATEFKSKIDGNESIDDFVAFNESLAIAVEIKITKGDFLKDFRKIKHKIPRENLYYNKFYFCVPEKIKDFVAEYLDKNDFRDYGLLFVTDFYSISKHKEASFFMLDKPLFEINKDSNKLDKNCHFYSLIKRMNTEFINQMKANNGIKY